MDQHLKDYWEEFFSYNAIILGLRGGKHSLIKANNFKKHKNRGFNMHIYCSKFNQQGLNNHEKAKILIILN